MMRRLASLFTRKPDKVAEAQADLARRVRETYHSPDCESYRAHRRAQMKARQA